MSYKILQANTRQELERLVMELIVKGWKCVGGVSVACVSDRAYSYYQAMIIL